MKNCETEAKVASLLPDFAMGAHGNLSQQQRLVGPQRGIDTQPRAKTEPAAAPAQPATALLTQHACFACHQIDTKLVGPAFKDVAAKYAKDKDAADKLAQKIIHGGSGVWGPVPMPPNAVTEDEAKTLAKWVLSVK